MRSSSGPAAALSSRLAAGEVIVIDGATGTELERHGVPMVDGAWCGDAVRTHPDEHVVVHRSHLDAGAELIVANTYASTRHLLAHAGLDEHFELINRRAVELAINARARAGRDDAAVAGSISSTHQGHGLPGVAEVRRNYHDQAQILAGAGADLIVLVMMRDVDHTRACAQAAIASGLPVWLGWSCHAQGHDEPLLWEESETLRTGLDAVSDLDIDVMMIMHTEVVDVDACLDVLDEQWSGPTGVYAHSGEFVHPNWVFDGIISAADYCEHAMRWLDRGVQVIGGCCGITADHIETLADAVGSR